MTPKDKIGKLEALLAKIKSRASGPRTTNGVSAHAQPAAVATSPAFVPAAAPPRPATVPPMPPPKAPSTVPPPATARPTPAPPTPVPMTQADSHDSVEVEVSSEVVEVDIDVDEPNVTPMMAESGAQPVAEHAPLPDEPEPEPLVHAGPPANEIEEPTPSSSPRPIADTVYDAEESAPRHTPPPESGKQVAATPVPPRKTSQPPPSLEGHTLIGGWREPGLGPMAAPPAAPQGVRVPAPPPHAMEAASTVVQHVPPEPPPPPRASMAPEVTRPDLSGSAKVASFQGAPPAPKPATFGSFIDDTLDI